MTEDGRSASYEVDDYDLTRRANVMPRNVSDLHDLAEVLDSLGVEYDIRYANSDEGVGDGVVTTVYIPGLTAEFQVDPTALDEWREDHAAYLAYRQEVERTYRRP